VTEPTRWLEVRVSGSVNRQAVIDALFAIGSEGAQEGGDYIVTHLPASASPDRIRSAILAADGSTTVAIVEAAPADWSSWSAAVQSHEIGALTVTPPWLAGAGDLASTVVIEPAMAFGTGEHGTTRGVIRLMQEFPLADMTVADLGAGSAVLSIAAAKLGATRVIAIELDQDATENALLNIRVNGVADRVHFIEGDAQILLPLIAPVDLIVANILSSVINDLLPVMHDSLMPGGRAILSGILVDERPMILKALAGGAWRVDAEHAEEDWWSVLVSRL
jgi:ribosomal protein L11 methyltransferase